MSCKVHSKLVKKLDKLWNEQSVLFEEVNKYPYGLFLFGLIAEVQKQVPSVEEGEVLKPLMKCYTALEVSSSKGDISKYEDFDFDLTQLCF